MSGFLAIAWDGPASEDVVDRIVRAGSHRGRANPWSEPGVTLVSFGDASLAVSEDLAVVLDARLDDRRGMDARFGRSTSDAERLARAWRAYGPASIDGVLGDHAGAVWDRATKTLYAFRDPTVGRPAFVARSDHRLIAASSLVTILADPAIDRSVDDEFIASFLSFSDPRPAVTGYRAVERLLPGSVATAGRSRWAQRREAVLRPAPAERTVEASAERFRETFDRAVADRIRDARRVGIALSGGLDSSAIAVCARAVRPDVAITAHAIPFDGVGDERSYQRAVAERIRAPIRWVSLEGRHALEDPRAALSVYGAPPFGPNHYYVEALMDSAAADGADVFLDGIDGDGVVGGSLLYLSDLLATGRWRALRREVRAIGRLHGASQRTIVKRWAVEPLIPRRVRAAIRSVRGHGRVPRSIRPSFARAKRMAVRLEPVGWHPGRSFAAEERARMDVSGLWPVALDLADEAASVRGVRVARPFFDRRVVELCLGMPRHHKLAGGITKRALRIGLGDRLPAAVAERAEKANLSGAFSTGLSRYGGPLVLQGLSLAETNCQAWLDGRALVGIDERLPRGTRLYEAYRAAWLGWWLDWVDGADRTVVADRR